jgi:ABC-2 type transport system ATP-binding protein
VPIIAPPAVIEFQSVSKVYRTGFMGRRRICALCNVTLSVPRGCVFGVVGPNRAGKTTLVKTLLSLCRPTAGTVLRLGQPVQHRHTLSCVGYLHESQAFPRYLTATTLLRYYGRLSFVESGELARRIAPLLEQVGLADRADEPIWTFSKGMVQRLALAQALVNDPELLVLDEPTEGMDLTARKLLHDVVGRHKAEGKTTVLVSHSLADVQRLCDRVAVLRGGRLVFTGLLAQLMQEARADDPADALQNVLEPMYSGVAS